ETHREHGGRELRHAVDDLDAQRFAAGARAGAHAADEHHGDAFGVQAVGPGTGSAFGRREHAGDEKGARVVVGLETGQAAGGSVVRGASVGVGDRYGDFHGEKTGAATASVGVRTVRVLDERRNGAAGAVHDQGAQVGGEHIGRVGGVAHGEVKEGLAEDGVLQRRV